MPRTATLTRTSPRAPAPEPGAGVGRRVARLTLAAAACAILAGAAPTALAQVSLDEPPLDEHDAKRVDRIEKAVRELRAIVFQGRETGAPVVVQPADTEGQINRVTDRLNDVDQTLAKLNGELEVIRHDLDQSHRDVEDLRSANATLREQVTSLQKTVQALSAPPPPAAPSAEAAPPPAPAAADPATQFAAARAALEQGDMATAEAGFRAYIDQAGDGPRGPEARYYLARTLIARHAWPEAATADIGAIRGWPHTPWAPAAVIDLSRALVAMDKAQDACQALGELSRRYPKAPPTVLKEAVRLRAEARCA
jgi:TolA-binding protein